MPKIHDLDPQIVGLIAQGDELRKQIKELIRQSIKYDVSVTHENLRTALTLSILAGSKAAPGTLDMQFPNDSVLPFKDMDRGIRDSEREEVRRKVCDLVPLEEGAATPNFREGYFFAVDKVKEILDSRE